MDFTEEHGEALLRGPAPQCAEDIEVHQIPNCKVDASIFLTGPVNCAVDCVGAERYNTLSQRNLQASEVFYDESVDVLDPASSTAFLSSSRASPCFLSSEIALAVPSMLKASIEDPSFATDESSTLVASFNTSDDSLTEHLYSYGDDVENTYLTWQTHNQTGNSTPPFFHATPYNFFTSLPYPDCGELSMPESEGNAFVHPEDLKETISTQLHPGGDKGSSVTPRRIPPPPDSGYGSKCHPDIFSSCHERSITRDLSTPLMNDSEARTSYSVASAVKRSPAQQYIIELASGIHHELVRHSSIKAWQSLPPILPEVIKSFAIQIGLNSSSQTNRSIMYFIHKRGRQIGTQLMSNFEDEADIDEPPREDTSDHMAGMSVEDKLRLWNSKMDVSCPSPPQQDRFEGIEDAEEDTLGPAAMSDFRSIVLSGSAFHWLIARLRNEMSLQWDQDNFRIDTRREIRKAILECLPTGRISKKNPPKTHTVKFRLLEWPFVAASSWQCVDLEQGVFVRRPTFESLIVVYCKDGSQAIPLKNYLEQVWPSSWVSLLNLLLPVMHYFEDHSPNKPCIVELVHSSSASLRATFEGEHLVVTVQGSSYLIAEFGEQLAWLSAAVSRHYDGSIAYRTPVVFRQDVQETMLSEDVVGFDITVREEVKDSLTLEEVRWTKILDRRFVVMAGFPILSRPVSLAGIEVPWGVLQDYIGEYNLTIGKGRVLLEGTYKTIALVSGQEDVYLWQNISNGRKPCCLSTEGLDIREPWAYLLALQQGRHILDPNDAPIDPDLCLHQMDVASTPDSSDRAQQTLRIENRSGTLRRASNTPTMGNNDLRSFIDLTADEGTPTEPSSQVDITDIANKSETSIESDFLSMSELSVEITIPRLSENDPIFDVVKEVALSLLALHSFQTRGKTTGGGDGFSSVTLATTQGQAPLSTGGQPLAKGKRKAGEGIESEQDRKRTCVGKKQELTLACPFWKLDTLKHHNCAKRKLTRVRDVKQHLNRNHTPKHYCQRCLRLFENDIALRQHVSDETGWSCTLATPDSLNGISHEQSRKLHKKSTSSQSDERQWFAIWEILFPGKARPRSAYMDPEISEDLQAFQEHLDARAGPVLHEALESAGLLQGITTEEETILVQRVISQALFGMQREWLSSRTLISQAPNSASSFAQTPRSNIHAGTPAASLADSGIALGQHTSFNVQPTGSYGPLPLIEETSTYQPSSVVSMPEALTGPLLHDFTEPIPSILSNLTTGPFYWGQTDGSYEEGLPLNNFATTTHANMNFAPLLHVGMPCFNVGGTETQTEVTGIPRNQEEPRVSQSPTSSSS
ncbi:hypothetical protein CPAR01_00834 [Colletotrichum paranaense]|uniref:C2H2-type domain-containing protein n=1 Tax=Colletotrichum paranaense TaxID=1914294 RepID=A0ABQ9T512_9PEZI|nr:uncharacterized protein CPAR01_00834 [Colletotrichum paranaense]KAK1546867.1 hypothetical protein CPAR01_00834 [Colletotrichum paranaense]